MNPQTQAANLEDQLRDAGYRLHDVFREFTDGLFQKKFCDDRGVKYFINFWRYPEFKTLSTSFTMELISNSPHMRFEVCERLTLPEYEALAEKFWWTMECEYYELYETPAPQETKENT